MRKLFKPILLIIIRKKMASIVLIETNGTVKTLKTKELTADTLYKKCGFRVNEDFLCRHTWRVKITSSDKESKEKETYTVSVWAKKTGKANGENKYDFPPPIDKDLFFGTCAIVRTKDKVTNNDGTEFIDLTKETWLKIYEKLFGGFEDIGDEDEYSEDELENVDPALLTKNGYLKDGFVVSDKELTSGAPSTDEEEDGEKKKPVKKIVKKRIDKVEKKTKVKTEKKKDAAEVKVKEIATEKKDEESNSESEETTSELEEEVYMFSDDD